MDSVFDSWLREENITMGEVQRRTGIPMEALRNLRWGTDSLTDDGRAKIAKLMGVETSEVASSIDDLRMFNGGS